MQISDHVVRENNACLFLMRPVCRRSLPAALTRELKTRKPKFSCHAQGDAGCGLVKSLQFMFVKYLCLPNSQQYGVACFFQTRKRVNSSFCSGKKNLP